MAKKSWVQLVNEWHLWPGLVVAVVGIIAAGFFLLIALVR